MRTMQHGNFNGENDMVFLADALGNLWWTTLVFVAGGVCALVFRPLINKMLGK